MIPTAEPAGSRQRVSHMEVYQQLVLIPKKEQEAMRAVAAKAPLSPAAVGHKLLASGSISPASPSGGAKDPQRGKSTFSRVGTGRLPTLHSGNVDESSPDRRSAKEDKQRKEEAEASWRAWKMQKDQQLREQKAQSVEKQQEPQTKSKGKSSNQDSGAYLAWKRQKDEQIRQRKVEQNKLLEQWERDQEELRRITAERIKKLQESAQARAPVVHDSNLKKKKKKPLAEIEEFVREIAAPYTVKLTKSRSPGAMSRSPCKKSPHRFPNQSPTMKDRPASSPSQAHREPLLNCEDQPKGDASCKHKESGAVPCLQKEDRRLLGSRCSAFEMKEGSHAAGNLGPGTPSMREKQKARLSSTGSDGSKSLSQHTSLSTSQDPNPSKATIVQNAGSEKDLDTEIEIHTSIFLSRREVIPLLHLEPPSKSTTAVLGAVCAALGEFPLIWSTAKTVLQDENILLRLAQQAKILQSKQEGTPSTKWDAVIRFMQSEHFQLETMDDVPVATRALRLWLQHVVKEVKPRVKEEKVEEEVTAEPSVKADNSTPPAPPRRESKPLGTIADVAEAPDLQQAVASSDAASELPNWRRTEQGDTLESRGGHFRENSIAESQYGDPQDHLLRSSGLSNGTDSTQDPAHLIGHEASANSSATPPQAPSMNSMDDRPEGLNHKPVSDSIEPSYEPPKRGQSSHEGPEPENLEASSSYEDDFIAPTDQVISSSSSHSERPSECSPQGPSQVSSILNPGQASLAGSTVNHEIGNEETLEVEEGNARANEKGREDHQLRSQDRGEEADIYGEDFMTEETGLKPPSAAPIQETLVPTNPKTKIVLDQLVEASTVGPTEEQGIIVENIVDSQKQGGLQTPASPAAISEAGYEEDFD